MIQFLISATNAQRGCIQFDFACNSEQEAFDFCHRFIRRAFCSSLSLFRIYERQGEEVLEPILFL